MSATTSSPDSCATRKCGDYIGLTQAVIALAKSASVEIMRVYAGNFAIQRKADKSPVTEADLAADAVLRAGLAPLLSDCPVFSEEVSAPSYEQRRQWHRYWLVDPLDGTRGFIKRNDQFAVSVALVENHEPVLGVVLEPVSGRCYYAYQGGGAYCLEPDASARLITTRKPAAQPYVLTTSASRSNTLINAFIDECEDVDLRELSSCIKACLVAIGTADLYPGFSPTCEWDTAATQCIVEEAGGCVLDIETFAPLRYNTRPSTVNPPFIVVGDPQCDWRARLTRAKSRAKK